MLGNSSANRSIATLLTAKDNASSDLEKVEQKGDDVSDSMEGAEGSSRSLNRSFVALAGVTTALTGALGMLVRQHGETEQTFARLRTVTGATEGQMESLRSTAIQLGTDLPVSVGQASQALEQLAFAGFSAEESIAAANGVANLAVASSMNVAESARAASSAVRMFGMEADETHQVTASLAAVFSESSTNMRELNSVIERAGPVADTAGVSLNELAAAAGVLGDQGIRASRAGTALENTIRNITTGSGQAEEALRELGLSVDDLTDEHGELDDLTTVFGTLNDRMEGLDGRAERLAVATELAGQRGARALLPLLDNSEKLQEKLGAQFRSEVRESIGELARLSDEEIAGVESALGDIDIDAQDITPQEIFEQLEKFEEDGESAEEIAARMEAALNISGQAAEHFAEGLASGEVTAEEFAESVGDATTASELAAEQMDTTAGAVEFLRSSVSAFTFSMHSGASPAIKFFNQQLASGINVVNENRAVGAALGGTMVALAGATGLATAALGAHILQLKLATVVQNTHASSTIAGTAATKAYTAATIASRKAVWLLTASKGQLAAATVAKTTALWASVTALGASAAASLTSAGAMGILSGAAGLAAAGVTALWTALGPIGLLALGVTAAVLGLVAVMQTDLFGAGDRAAAILGTVSGVASSTGAAIRELIGIVYELGRISITGLALAPIALIAGLLKLPDLVRSVGPQVKDAAMRLPGAIVSGLSSLGPAKYALPVLGPLLLAKDVITDPDPWIDTGRSVVSSIVSGLGRLGPAKYLLPVIGPMLAARDAIANRDRWISLGSSVISSIVGGLGRFGPAKYALPILGPLLLAKDIITDPKRWFEAGQSVISTITSGIKDMASSPVDAVKDIAGGVRDVLPFSDAKEGPLSTLTASGSALVKTLVEGAQSEAGELNQTITQMLADTPVGGDGGGLSSVLGGSSTGGSGSDSGGSTGPIVYVDITLDQENNITGEMLDPERIREVVREASRGGEEALKELELILQQAVMEA